VRQWLQAHELKGDLAVLTEGPSTKYPDSNHRLEIIELNR
jgi:pyruvate kinase